MKTMKKKKKHFRFAIFHFIICQENVQKKRKKKKEFLCEQLKLKKTSISAIYRRIQKCAMQMKCFSRAKFFRSAIL